MIQTNVASLSAYCVRACKIKHFTEREFSGIFSLAGGGKGDFAFLKREFPVALLQYYNLQNLNEETGVRLFWAALYSH